MSLLWLAGCVLAIVALALALSVRAAAGKRIRLKGGSLYYSGSVTAEEAERAGRFLVAKGYFKGGLTDVRLYRCGTTYQLQVIVDGGKPTEEQSSASEILAAGFSDEVLAGAACEVQYCNGALHPIAVIPHQGRLGRRMVMNAAELYYTDGVTERDAMGVATFLVAAGVFNDSSKVAQLNREGDGFDFRVAVEVDPLTAEMIDGQPPDGQRPFKQGPWREARSSALLQGPRGDTAH